jgi:hypothetical protein
MPDDDLLFDPYANGDVENLLAEFEGDESNPRVSYELVIKALNEAFEAGQAGAEE